MPFLKKLIDGSLTLNAPGLPSLVIADAAMEVTAGDMRLYGKPIARAKTAGLLEIVSNVDQIPATQIIPVDDTSADLLNTGASAAVSDAEDTQDTDETKEADSAEPAKEEAAEPAKEEAAEPAKEEAAKEEAPVRRNKRA